MTNILSEMPASVANAAEQALLAEVEKLVVGASPKTQAVVAAATAFGQQVAAHPQPSQLIASGLNLALSFFGTSFQF